MLSQDMATTPSTRPCKTNEPMKPLPFTSDMSTMAIVRNASGNVLSVTLQFADSPNPIEGAHYGMALLFSSVGNILPL